MLKELRAAVVAIVVLTVLLGVGYPLAMTAVGQTVFPGKADGSLVERDDRVVGSSLIGQDHDGDPRFFQDRPSATGYAPSATFFNNLGPNSADLAAQLKEAAAAYLKRERPTSPGLTVGDIPPDAVTTSASGVDPHISPENAEIQARRVAAARGLPLATVMDLVADATDQAFLGFAGEDGVNVLELNLALEGR
ncbi:potassium-transporting ATPase subunit KdpC [Conexibacter sp. W3-3-2]|uniref:potassium-transporting ATPase subunit KdpC n=1 Tax=Conexibacter sp. W3-3-2 TaxID=2675227 RepID=UPI0012B906EF|nr:potassium-transporting ATPase subunit KdpC [Conexibacter sp. W3-3-2]MTD46733.1 potassium-transporting ATPase subunit KdpC [Conexibacter sp. W3-3-2]